MERRYAIWDVFTSTPLAGNPLAVVLDAGGLTTESMQALAREFNLSETVFVLPPRLPAHTAQVRIFSPSTELQFAGHPTVGAAIQLADGEIVAAVPEPGTWASLLAGAAMLGVWQQRNRRLARPA